MQHWHTEHRRARVDRRCDLCRRTIERGERYLRGAGMDGSSAWSWVECAHCEALRSKVDVTNVDDEYHQDTIAEWEPATIAELRLKVLWQRRWRRSNGSLYPVPTFA